MAYAKTLTLALAAAVSNGIAQVQTLVGAGNLTLNGSLVSGGVATLDSGGYARRVLLTFAADETGHNFTITGTGWNGNTQSEVIAGTTAGTVVSVRDYKTVTSIASSAATTGNVSAGTNAVASTQPWIVDPWTNANNIGCGLDITGTMNVTIQYSMNDYSPAWDLNNVTPLWADTANFASKSSDTVGLIAEPLRMIRMLQNSGTGSAVASFIQPAVTRGA